MAVLKTDKMDFISKKFTREKDITQGSIQEEEKTFIKVYILKDRSSRYIGKKKKKKKSWNEREKRVLQ